MAYKYKTFDYLSKPVCDERLEETILRLVEDRKNIGKKFVKIDRNTIINANDINYIKKDGMKLISVLQTGTMKYIVLFQNSKVACQTILLDAISYIINVNNIANLTANENTIFFDHNVTCFIGAKYKNKLLEVFKYGTFTNNLECVNK